MVGAETRSAQLEQGDMFVEKVAWMPKSKLFANEGAKSLHAKETSAAWIATVVLEAVVFVLCCHAIAILL